MCSSGSTTRSLQLKSAAGGASLAARRTAYVQQPGTRRNYKANLAQIEPVFDLAAWEDITLLVLTKYLTNRRNKNHKTKRWPPTRRRTPSQRASCYNTLPRR